MSNKITYYAIIGRGATVDQPLGLLRRLEHDDGPEDEGLRRDLSWHRTALIVEWENGSTDEALYNFERATAEVPKAHLAAADILAERGQRDEAIRHLEEYLHISKPDDKERGWAEARLAELRH